MSNPVRQIPVKKKKDYNQAVNHVVQSWEWGDFRKKTGLEIIRQGKFKKNKLIQGHQLSFHPLPFCDYTVGYLPKGPLADKSLIKAIKKIGKKKKAVFIKLEPNVVIDENPPEMTPLGLVLSSQPLFTKHNFLIDLTLSEKKLLKKMKSKTRYNVRLAKRKGVVVEEKKDEKSFKAYLNLYFETCRRQGYFGHDRKYHRLMWETLRPAGMAHLLIASFKGEPLGAWMLLKFKKTLYYPYGGSSVKHRNLMASNLLCWEAMKLGKKLGCETFDLWGALGPEAERSHPWYGWHRFKAGYKGELVEYLGSFDLVLKPVLYRLFNFANQARWKYLRVKSSLKFR